jgi:hypothetical protein
MDRQINSRRPCKQDSVCPRESGGLCHLSWPAVTDRLQQPTRSDSGDSRGPRDEGKCFSGKRLP